MIHHSNNVDSSTHEMQCAGAASSYAVSVCCFVVNIFPGSGGDAISVAPVCEEYNACVVNWIGSLILAPSAGVYVCVNVRAHLLEIHAYVFSPVPK